MVINLKYGVSEVYRKTLEEVGYVKEGASWWEIGESNSGGIDIVARIPLV